MSTIGELKGLLKACHKAWLPVFLWGPPGVGKSAMIRWLAKELGIDLIDLRLALLNPVDLRGFPWLDKETSQTRWMPPVFLPKEGAGILFIDELNAAPPAVQAAAYQLILDRALGEYKLPEGWWIVAAGNRGTDRALVYDMPSALRNRMVHLEVEPSVDDWLDWAWEHNIDSRIIAFINFKNAMLFQFDPKVHKRAFPTPRSWEFVSRLLVVHAPNLDLVAGAVGEGAAHEFMAFVKVMDKLPSAQDVLEGKKIEVPKEPSCLYALAGSLVGKLQGLTGKKHLEAARKVIKFCAEELPPEFAVLTVKDYARTRKFKEFSSQLFTCEEWKGFSQKFGDLILK
jgi:hypothetical protein